MITSISAIKHFENSVETIDEIDLDDLETIVITELLEGLPSDTVFNCF